MTTVSTNTNHTPALDYNNFKNFDYKSAIRKQKVLNTKACEKKTNKINAGYIAGAAAISALVIGGLIYSNSIKKGVSFKAIKHILDDNPDIKTIFDKFNLENYPVFNNPKEIKHLDNIRFAIAAKQTGKEFENLKLPSLINFQNIHNCNFSEFSQILSDALKVKNLQYEYHGNIVQFIESLEEISQKNEKEIKFLNILNGEKFAKDFNKLEENKLKERFFNTLKILKQNNTVILDNKNTFNKYIRKADQKSGSNAFHVTNDLTISYEKFKKTLNGKLKAKQKLFEENFKYFDFEKKTDISNLAELTEKGNNKNILLTAQKAQRALLLDRLQEYSDVKIYSTQSKNPREIEELLIDLEEKFLIKGKQPQYLYLENFNSIPSQEYINTFKGLLDKWNSKYYTKFIIPSDKGASIVEQNDLYDLHIKNLADDKFFKELSDKLNPINLNVFRKAYKRLLEKFNFNFLEMSQFGGLSLNKNLNILINNPSASFIDKVSNNIKKYLDFNTISINFDKNDFQKSIEELNQKLDNAQEFFEKTGKYSIIELEGFDELLCDTTQENKNLIEKFSNMMRDINTKHHAIAILKTQRPQEQLSINAINEQRFLIRF